ncbi:MAG: hypothetical protein EBV03_03235 [Proteobacteria bacterium]|nr:hypothetical protein [Pseudomonadota bacterium]
MADEENKGWATKLGVMAGVTGTLLAATQIAPQRQAEQPGTQPTPMTAPHNPNDGPRKRLADLPVPDDMGKPAKPRLR